MEEIFAELPPHFIAIFTGIFIAIVCSNLNTDGASNRVASFGLLLSVILIVSGVFMYFY
jgi:hypothetical protein